MELTTKLARLLTPGEKKRAAALSAGMLLQSLSETFSIGIIIPIVELFVNRQKIQASPLLSRLYAWSGLQGTESFLNAMILTAIVCFAVKTCYAVYMVYLQQKFIAAVDSRLKRDVLGAYLDKDYSFHLDNNSSLLFKNINAEVAQFTSGFLTSVLSICSEAIIMAGILVLLLAVYPLTTIAVMTLFSAVLIPLNFSLRKRISAYSAQREKYSERLYRAAAEALNAVKEIMVYHAKTFFVDKFAQATERYNDSFAKFSVVHNLPRYMLETLLFSTFLLALLLSGLFLPNPADLIPQLTILGVAMLRFLPSVYKIYTNLNLLHFSAVSLNIVSAIVREAEAPPRTLIASSRRQALKEDTQDVITLNNISFSYNGAASPIFCAFTMNIPFRKTTAIVGESGSGKSTLIDIIMGLLHPSEGALYYKKEPVSEANLAAYREKLGYVPQQIYLMDDTIAANIAFGLPSGMIDAERLSRVLKMSQLEAFIKELPDGLQTMVGERGVKLSGGQRQRIGIARALYRAPEILVLDEATSALDGHTEAEVSRAIRDLGKDMTVIIIAHRLSTIEHADVIYVLEKGTVADKGTYSELLEHSQAFQRVARQAAS